MTRTVNQTWHISASKEKVYEALTSPNMLAKWFLESAEFPTRAGEKYHFKWLGGHESSAKVLKLKKGKLVSLEWPQHDRNGKFLGNTIATFTVESNSLGSTLRVKHTGYGNSEEWIENYALTHSGWAYYIMNMKSVLHNGVDLRSEAGGEP